MRREKEAPVGLDIDDYSTDQAKVSKGLPAAEAMGANFFGPRAMP
jgi:hypothetical protein